MSNGIGGIASNFPQIPQVPSGSTDPAAYAKFEEEMMLYGAAVRAIETGIETVGDGMIHAANIAPAQG